MVGTFRPRGLLKLALLGALTLGLAACGGTYPNSTFDHNTEFNRAVDSLWDLLLLLGTIVFIGVEGALLYVMYKFRRRANMPDPKPVHGNTTIEILWTAIPAVILIFIAVPTVRTIFQTQAVAAADALQVEVIGHQWWWEFRYPQYTTTRPDGKVDTLVTANELYLQNGRTVSFQLKTVDVIHSFWIPQMGGKRDLITNRTNYLWFTPDDTLPAFAMNGACAEFCGISHANMKFRAYTVGATEFQQWVAHQLTSANFPVASAVPAPAAAIPVVNVGVAQTPVAARAADSAAAPPTAAASPVPVYAFPADRIASTYAFTIPQTPIPDGNAFDDALLANGDATRGQAAAAVCAGCHAIKGVSTSMIGPNLTHIGTRHTIGAGLYPNDARHLARWIKNSPQMKPGSKMTPLGKDAIDPATGKKTMMPLFTDQQIADIVAYLKALK